MLGVGIKLAVKFMAEYGYRSLVVWQKAKALAVEVYLLTEQETIKRDFSLVDQLRRSAVSVPSNIAEGDERKSDKDSVRFFHIAKRLFGGTGNATGNCPRSRLFHHGTSRAADWPMH